MQVTYDRKKVPVRSLLKDFLIYQPTTSENVELILFRNINETNRVFVLECLYKFYRGKLCYSKNFCSWKALYNFDALDFLATL